MDYIQSEDIIAKFNIKWKWLANPLIKELYIIQNDFEVSLKYSVLKTTGEIVSVYDTLPYGENNGPYFKVQDHITINSQKFLELDGLSLIHGCDYLFSQMGIEAILEYPGLVSGANTFEPD